MHVLIVDDDPFSRRFLTKSVKQWGYETVVAGGAQEALEILQRSDAPRLAIVDWMMPSMNGIELCRFLRRTDTEQPTYMIMLTGKDQTDDLVEAMEAGADDFATKSNDVRELRVRLRAGQRIVELQDRLVLLATKDALTQLWNRRAILDILKRELSRLQRSRVPVGVAIGDIDHFKQINDRHGHAAGDIVLTQVASRMQDNLRPYDSIGRYGGEEFLIVLPGCADPEALTVAERLRANVAGVPIGVGDQAVPVTSSFGVAVSETDGPHDADVLIQTADAALYRAKEAGRNRVEAAEKPQTVPEA